MTDHDRLFKELLATFFSDFVRLFLPGVDRYLDHDSLSFLDKELFTDVTAGDVIEADLVIKARFRNSESFFLIHTEAQAQPQAEFGRRLFRYFARLHEKYALPVYPVVVYSFEYPKSRQPAAYDVHFPDLAVLSFRYAAIQLNRLHWRQFLQHKNPVAAALMAKMQIAPGDRLRVKLECLRMLATLNLEPARQRMISGFIDTYLRLSAEEMGRFLEKVTTLSKPEEREGVMEIVTSWMEEGMRKGLLQGREEGREEGRQVGWREGQQHGRQEEAASLVTRLLRRCLGQLDASLLEDVQRLSLEQLEELSEALLDFSSASDLENWLTAHPRH